MFHPSLKFLVLKMWYSSSKGEEFGLEIKYTDDVKAFVP